MKNVRALIYQCPASHLLHLSFRSLIKYYLGINAEDEGFLISSRWMVFLVSQKDQRIASFLFSYQLTTSQWCTGLDFCDASDRKSIDQVFETELLNLLAQLLDYSESTYGPIYIENKKG